MVKRFFIILGVVISVLLIGLFFSYDYWLEKELKFQLSEIVSEDPNSLYNYNFEKLNIDLINGSVNLRGISIEPRNRGYDSLMSDSSAVRFLLKLHLAEIDLLKFEIREFINTGRIVVQELRLEQPAFYYYFNPNKPKKDQKMPIGQIFSDQFKSANIKKLSIIDGQVEIDNYLTEDPALHINYLTAELLDAYMDQNTIKNVAPIEYQEIKLRAASITADISPNFSIVSDSLHFNALEESFIIRDFQIKPKYNQQAWAKMHEIQKQWFALTLGSLSLRKIDIEHFISSGEIKVGSIRLRQPNVALYKDKSKPEPPFRKKPLPATAIRSIPMKLNVDSVQIIDGYVAISETSKLTGLDSHISFYNLNGTLTNFTNLAAADRQSNFMELNASTMMYKQALVKLHMKFDLESPIDQFTASGSVDSVDMTTFNPVLEPMMAAKVSGGRLHKMSFEFVAMDTLSKGVTDIEYNNAKIELIAKDTAATKQKKGFLSLAANTIVKSNNNIDGPNYIQGVINAQRVQNKDVWPYLWHSIQSGVISTLAPITNNKEAKQQQKLNRQQLKQEKKEGKD